MTSVFLSESGGHAVPVIHPAAADGVFSLLTMQTGRLPPTINYPMPDPAIPMDVVPNVARDADVRYTISNSFGFGGQNVSLVMAREPA